MKEFYDNWLLILGHMIGLQSSFVDWMLISILISANMMKILSMWVWNFVGVYFSDYFPFFVSNIALLVSADE